MHNPSTRPFALLAALILCATIAACGSKKTETDNTPATDKAKAETPKDTKAKPDAKPETKPKTLTIYSGRNEKLVGDLIAQFEKDKGFKVRVKYGETQPLAAALVKEGDKSEADIFFAQEASTLAYLSSKGVLAPLPKDAAKDVPAHFKASDNTWTGVSGRARVLVYNTDKVKAEDLPKDVSELTDPKWKGRIGWPPENASFKSFVSAMIQLQDKDKAIAWLKGVQANEPKTYPKNTPAVRATAKGEIDVALVNHYYLYRVKKELGDKIPAKNHYFKNAKSGSLINISGVGVVKTSKNQEGAQEFIQYLLSNAGQTYFTTKNYEFPLMPGVKNNIDLPDISSLNPPKVDFSKIGDLEATEEALRTSGVQP